MYQWIANSYNKQFLFPNYFLCVSIEWECGWPATNTNTVQDLNPDRGTQMKVLKKKTFIFFQKYGWSTWKKTTDEPRVSNPILLRFDNKFFYTICKDHSLNRKTWMKNVNVRMIERCLCMTVVLVVESPPHYSELWTWTPHSFIRSNYKHYR